MRFNIKINPIIERQQVSTIFFIILSFYFLLVFFSKHFIETKETILLTYNHLSIIEQERMIETRKIFDWRPYAFQFFSLLFYMFYYSFFIYIGTIINYKKINIKVIYKIVLIAEIINVGMLAVSLFILYSYIPLNLNTLKYYTPLSLSSVLPNIELQNYTTIFFSSINLFLLIYLLFLSFLLHPYLYTSFGKTVVFTTIYGGIGYGILVVIKILFAYVGGF